MRAASAACFRWPSMVLDGHCLPPMTPVGLKWPAMALDGPRLHSECHGPCSRSIALDDRYVMGGEQHTLREVISFDPLGAPINPVGRTGLSQVRDCHRMASDGFGWLHIASYYF